MSLQRTFTLAVLLRHLLRGPCRRGVGQRGCNIGALDRRENGAGADAVSDVGGDGCHSTGGARPDGRNTGRIRLEHGGSEHEPRK